MFKKSILLISLIFLGACTFVNPEQEEESITDGEETTDIQFDQPEEPTTEEKIRYNAYPNPYEYYEQRETDESLGNTDNRDRIRDEKFKRRNELNRQIYYELRNMREIREAGVAVTEDQIYVAVYLASRVEEEEAIEKVKEVVENITGRTDISVSVDEEFHNRIEDRQKD
ncbi:YhcN/YlaJ family sporulation lipoprotein [Piscibacillus halophilus]|uniref:Sporulation lipoprotein YhcN/YlaJ (Spore_YhcN_YlaJ) n=1 Tax=Piscibacillus halophilus TaxID=571933 RepID=A0A1H9BWQ8_9BACI|nr:YhcN/YlaJ family sporulation lipoprotein [Piscibacillus halophilus]SEP93227.1 Sporulation lipoprotein YhcN/YlaJ (Spore_YhcN_YlaJ) [Piscibacillus halophilus]